MWWNHASWEPMHGWWFIPLFGLIYMGIFLFFIFRVFNQDRRGHGPSMHHLSQRNQKEKKLLDEVKELRREVAALQKNYKKK